MKGTQYPVFSAVAVAAVFFGVAAFEGFVAWWMHKFVTHGFGWFRWAPRLVDPPMGVIPEELQK
jgi:hypothetical protein